MIKSIETTPKKSKQNDRYFELDKLIEKKKHHPIFRELVIEFFDLGYSLGFEKGFNSVLEIEAEAVAKDTALEGFPDLDDEALEKIKRDYTESQEAIKENWQEYQSNR